MSRYDVLYRRSLGDHFWGHVLRYHREPFQTGVADISPSGAVAPSVAAAWWLAVSTQPYSDTILWRRPEG